MPRVRCLMLGAGGMAGNWLRRFLVPFADRLEIVALVDVNRTVLDTAAAELGLPASHRFTDMIEAFRTVEADCCIIVIPPAYHRPAALLAAERGLPILSEKPIADTWEACADVYRTVKQTGVKLAVMQNYRYNPPMLTFRQALRHGRVGRLNYLVGRFAQDYRLRGAWGAFRHEIPHALLVEGTVHHFDMLRNLADADCRYLAGWEWNPAWSQSDGAFNGLFTLQLTNGVHAGYEGSGTAAGTQHPWHHEYYRAEGETGSLVVESDGVVRLYQHTRGQGLRMAEVPEVAVPYPGHTWVIDEFLNWLDGGPTPATVVDDNLKSVAMVFAAIEASRTNQVVDVQAMIEAVRVPPKLA